MAEGGKFPEHAIFVPYNKVPSHLIADIKNRPSSKTITITKNKVWVKNVTNCLGQKLGGVKMFTLKPVNFNFKISTTDLELVYTESGGVRIEVGAIPLKSIDNKCVSIAIFFSIVAEIKCVTLNFDESNYSGFCISEEVSTGDYLENDEERFRHPDSGFYEVVDSEYLQKNKKKYDPKNRLNLKHYIVKGYDSYIELVASSTYSLKELL